MLAVTASGTLAGLGAALGPRAVHEERGGLVDVEAAVAHLVQLRRATQRIEALHGLGRCVEMWGDVGRCGEMWRGVGDRALALTSMRTPYP